MVILSTIAFSPLAAAAEAPSYYRDVRPVLQRNCQGCHQPSLKSSGLDVTSFAEFARGGRRGAAFRAGAAADSLILKYMRGEMQPAMPMGAPPLPKDQIEAVAAWIAGGAKDDTPAEAADTISAEHPPVYSQPPVIGALAFSPDGQTLAVAGYREILLHKADGSGLVRRLVGQSERLNSLAYTRDGKTLVAAGGSPARFGEIQVWDTAAGTLRKSITLTGDTVFGGSVTADGGTIAVGAADNSVRLIDAASGRELQKIGNHENWVLGTAFGVDGKRVVSVSKDRAAKLSDVASGGFLENVNLLRGELSAIARKPGKDLVVIGGEERIPYIYMMDRPKVMKIADDTTLVRKLPRQDGVIAALAWSGGSKERIAVAGLAPVVNVYDAETGGLVAACSGHKAGVYAVAFDPSGERLAAAGFDGHVRIYKTENCEMQKDFVPVPLMVSRQ